MRDVNVKYFLSLLLVVVFQVSLSGQILKDTTTLSLLKKGVDHIYNCEFSQARGVLSKLESAYPGHPVLYLFRGMTTYWEHFPLTPASKALGSFKADMFKCIALCEKRRLLPGEAEYLLADIGSRGLLLTHFADNGLGREVVPMATRTYQDVVRAFDYTESYADFLFVTGLYNYYRETYPEVHPFYKPFAILFPRGNKEKGLAQLEKAARNAIFLKAEATSFLTWISVGYEAAYRFSKMLYTAYPRNNEYLAMHVKNLLLLKRYDEAEEWLSKASQPESHWFDVEKRVLQAILQEKKYKNSETAGLLYQSAIQKAGVFGEYANEYLSFCYFGLSRIAAAKGDSGLSRDYHKKAVNLATYKHLDFRD